MNPFLVDGLISIAVLLVLLTLGMHIALALALSGFVGLTLMTGLEPAIWKSTTSFYYRIASYELITVPLFVMMGLLAAGGGISADLYDAAELWVGKIPGGLGIATVLGCTGFGTVCGSSLVTASVFAKVAAPHMRRHGYDKKLAYGICASAGMIGMLIPPSVLIVIYGFVSGESVGKLLIGGTYPGLLLMVLFCLGLFFIPKVKPDWIQTASLKKQTTWGQRIGSLGKLWPVVFVAFVIFGGMFGGVFNATEASSVAVFVLILVMFVIKPRIAVKEITSSLRETAAISAMIFFILAGAGTFAQLLALSGISQWIGDTITGMQLSPVSFMIAVTVVYLILGCFLDSTSMVVMTVPVLHPLAIKLGIDPIWYALVMITVMHIGLITPPVGLNVFGVQAVAEKDITIENVFAGSVPFILLSIVAVIIMIAFPKLVTLLPNLMVPT
jgi:tripartite ATP-independent transporter DctM subunit